MGNWSAAKHREIFECTRGLIKALHCDIKGATTATEALCLKIHIQHIVRAYRVARDFGKKGEA